MVSVDVIRPRRAGLVVALALAGALCGCGSSLTATAPAPTPARPGSTRSTAPAAAEAPIPVARPQVVEPVAGTAAPAAAPSAAEPSSVSVGSPASGVGGSGSLPAPESLAQVRSELARSGMTANPRQATLTPGGLAVAPVDAPPAVQAIISAGNEIARLPYIWGGGHATYEDTGYDCSGSISFVFAAAGLLDHTVTSGELENWGAPGPGRWITVFANAGHTFMYVAGLRFDTVALAETGSRWSDRPADEGDLASFSVRHPPGL
jgi:cell wall-associated NlpC family hydrolase